MIHQIEGMLIGLTGMSAVVRMQGGITLEVMIPAYLARKLSDRIGQQATFLTHLYLEGQGQGASFIPRLIGFESAQDRKFFELFTTVKGIGNRKALRALEVEPAAIARAIAQKDSRELVKLPEIGKRLAETIIAELTGKVDVYLASSELAELKPAGTGAAPARADVAGPEYEAVEALVALGEGRGEAERMVQQAVLRHQGSVLKSADEILGVVYGGR